VLASTVAWVDTRPDIRALGLAGSWARDEAQMSSDVDLVVLTDDVDRYTAADWVSSATGNEARIIGTEAWGRLVARRVELRSGLAVEYGFAPVSWALTESLDEGTAAVVADGFQILYDPDGVLNSLVAAVSR
jgi:hypothetical protein